MLFGNFQTIALEIGVLKQLTQKSSLPQPPGKEERVLSDSTLLGDVILVSPPLIRGKPVFQPCLGYQSGSWFEQQHSGYSLSGYDYGCAAERDGHNLSVRETSGRPAASLVTPKVPLPEMNPVSSVSPAWRYLFPTFTPPDALIQIPTAMAFAPHFNAREEKLMICPQFKSSLSSKNKIIG